MIEFSILAWLGCAIGAGAIASSKGRSGFGYFVLGFFLPFIGLLIAIGISDQRQQIAAASFGRQIKHDDLVNCWSCRRPYRADRSSCPDCGSPRQPDPHAGEKKCPACAEWIKAEAKKCKHCGEAVETPKAPEPRRPYGMGYCPGCAKPRGYDVPKCIYCGDTGPVIGHAPTPA